MSLKAGRVGVNPNQVDPVDGSIKSSATEGYTKQEADAKFETQEAAAALQPKTLAVPIEMLSGSKLTVESALQGLNTDKLDNNVVSGTITSDFTIDNDITSIVKIGKIVILNIHLTGVTLSAFTNSLFTVPEGFRPSKTYAAMMGVIGSSTACFCTVIKVSGYVQSSGALNNQDFRAVGCWVTD